MTRCFFACLLALGLAACDSAPEPPQDVTTSGLKAFVGARLIDGTGGAAIEPAAIVVRDGRIEAVGPEDAVAVPPGADRVDLAGKTVIPGLINSHGHVNDVRGLEADTAFYTEAHVLDQLGRYARYGVTTVFSLGGDGDAGARVRDAQGTPQLDRARLFIAGRVVTGETPDEAAADVAEVAETRADWVKIRVDDNLGASSKMPPAVYARVIEEAHRRDRRVAAHMYYLDDAKALLKAGADLLAHSVRDRPVDDELIALLEARDVCYCPTLMREVSTFVYETRPDFFDDPFFLKEVDPTVVKTLEDPAYQEQIRQSRSAQQYKMALETAKKNLKTLADAGVRIAMGTDTGPAARFQGYFEHRELELMVEAGLTPEQALQSATRDAAACMGVSDEVGTLQPGKWADFVVLTADPLENIRNTRTIDSVWTAGNRVPE